MVFCQCRIPCLGLSLPAILPMLVIQAEVAGDGDALGAPTGAVATACAGDRHFLTQDRGTLMQDLLFLFIQWLKILHIRNVVLDLLQVGHTG